MGEVIDKAKVAGIVAVFGAIATVVYGFTNFVLLSGIGTFLITLLIQYGSIKVKVLVPVAALLGFLSWSAVNGSIHI